MADGCTRYEVNVSFQIDQPDHLQLSQVEIEDNVRMCVEELVEIGFALIVPASVTAGVYPTEGDDA